jgi:hypothetical protein
MWKCLDFYKALLCPKTEIPSPPDRHALGRLIRKEE